MYQCIRGGETSRSHHTNAQKTSHLYLPKTSLFRPVCTILTHALKIGTEPAFVPIELRAQELLAAPSIHHSDICELWSLFPVSKRLKPTQQTASHQSYIVLGLRPPRLPEALTQPTCSLHHTTRALTKFVSILSKVPVYNHKHCDEYQPRPTS